MRTVVAHMRANAGQELHLEDMAGRVFMSRSQFVRTFVEHCGVSPGRFLSCVRFHQAKQLLVTTSDPVIDICSSVGYASLGTFTAQFTKYVGVTPGQFRLAYGELASVTTGAMLDLCRRNGAIGHQPSGPYLVVDLAGSNHLGMVFVGLFASGAPLGRPLNGGLDAGGGQVRLRLTPRTRHRLLAAGSPGGPEVPLGRYLLPDDEVHVGAATVQRETPSDDAAADTVTSIRLRPLSALDPPVVVALPLLALTGLP